MQVSVETLKGLERKVTISVPTEKVEEEVSLRLRNLARKVKVDGFRPGKVPLSVVERRFSESECESVARDMVQSTLHEALKDKGLVPAGYPAIEPKQLEAGKDFIFSATFEIYPEIKVNELNSEKVEIVQAEVKDADVQEMLEKLREQNKEWHEVSRKVKEGDKITIDFEGFIDNKAFDGGKAKDFEIILGSNSMIPGFEDGLLGAAVDKPFDLKVTFPKEYGAKELAGKKAVFKVVVTKVFEGKPPKLDNAFAEKFNIKDGGIEGLKKDIKENMTRELERRLSTLNREKIFDKLLEKNPFDLPMSLVDQEIEHLKHEMFHRLFGPEHKENEQIPDFPRSLFEEQAKRRVQLGLLFSEYVKKHQISAKKEQIDAMIEKFATAYENPDELRQWYRGNKERLAEIEGLVLEELVSEKILSDAKVSKITMNYQEVMNPKPEAEAKSTKKAAAKKESKKEKEDKGA